MSYSGPTDLATLCTMQSPPPDLPFTLELKMLGCPALPSFWGHLTDQAENAFIFRDYASPPVVQPPSTTLVPNGGTDVNGKPTYDVVTQTPDQVMAGYRQNVQDFFSSIAADENGSGSSGSSGIPWYVWVVGGVVAAGILRRLI